MRLLLLAGIAALLYWLLKGKSTDTAASTAAWADAGPNVEQGALNALAGIANAFNSAGNPEVDIAKPANWEWLKSIGHPVIWAVDPKYQWTGETPLKSARE